MVRSLTYLGNITQNDVYHASPGVYHIECWGGQGKSGLALGGKGGYVSGYRVAANSLQKSGVFANSLQKFVGNLQSHRRKHR